MRHSTGSFGACTLVVLAMFGCGGEPETPTVTIAALCADPEAYEGREIWVDVALDPSAFRLVLSTAAGCWEGAPCCNTGDYAFELGCDAGPDVVLVPGDYPREGRGEAPLICRGSAPGAFPAECPVTCGSAELLAIRRVRGTIGEETPDPFSSPPRPYRPLMVVETISAPIPDAGPLPDAR